MVKKSVQSVFYVYKTINISYDKVKRLHKLFEGEMIMTNRTKEEVFAGRQADYKQEKEEIFREAREVAKENHLVDDKVQYKGKRVYKFRRDKPE